LFTLSLVVLGSSGQGVAWAAADAPTIRLFPTTVLEDIRHTGDAAQEMETGLQEIITRLDQQHQLYLDSKCEGADGDPGCERIARQLGATYLEMLNTMGEKLPEMEEAVRNTHTSLQRRLRQELGRKLTPWTLQETLLGKSGEISEHNAQAEKPSLRGHAGLRLSDRFRQYYELVAHSGTKNSSSLAVVASDIYLDMEEAMALIEQTQQEISRAALVEQLNQSFGTVTPEMQEVVAGVKTILFGEPGEAIPVAGPPPAAMPQGYRSPLEM
jgi:hypothetical protein